MREAAVCMDNIKPLWDQILRLRKVMVLKDSETPWRKRKLDQFINDKLRARSGLGLPNQKTVTKKNRSQSSHASSVSCLLNSFDSTQCHDDKFSFDSCTCSSLTFDEALPEKQRRHLQPPRRSIRLLNFIGDHLQRKTIPVGPHFQADVPEWSGPVNWSVLIAAYKSDSDNSKWLGSRVWPIEIGNMKTTGRTIGKGRPNSCCCVSPGFSDCTIRHIVEERLLLQCDLGPAFFSWKFDEMGEQVSNSWSPKEQQTFEKLTRLSPVKQVDTDDDYEIQDLIYMGLQKRSGEESYKLQSEDVNLRYLHWVS
ncbi:AT-rich interactive domain-containing protein 1 [Sesamum angolense]|uniref:AT-rich interactive domain-containing protein 1 n=1 Tax=Sesamum angolense TaxID=2727404 RepID=A0AAE1WN21_9LAMI|nr:AT-rich interactive domain-containing protein 1 [Sesamum angolense]